MVPPPAAVRRSWRSGRTVALPECDSGRRDSRRLCDQMPTIRATVLVDPHFRNRICATGEWAIFPLPDK